MYGLHSTATFWVQLAVNWCLGFIRWQKQDGRTHLHCEDYLKTLLLDCFPLLLSLFNWDYSSKTSRGQCSLPLSLMQLFYSEFHNCPGAQMLSFDYLILITNSEISLPAWSEVCGKIAVQLPWGTKPWILLWLFKLSAWLGSECSDN